MRTTVLIVAAGRGTRAGGGIPKQYRDLCGEPVLRHTIHACLASDRVEKLHVVIHEDDVELYTAAASIISDARLGAPVFGGQTRSASVRNGLRACETELVLIHDGARPLLPKPNLEALIDTLNDTPAAFLAIPVVDALWEVSEGQAQSAKPRDTLWRGQTPQGFQIAQIVAAHEAAGGPMDDDVAIARAAGIAVTPVMGSERNIKITRPEDFELAEHLMKQAPDIRTGNGFDVHKFGPGNHVILNGIKIVHDQAMVGHSDADVAMHAVTDAIFGALAEGDIGQWFPPSDPQWKGAASSIFLEKAVERCAVRGFVISNLDCTIICEYPKIGPHSTAMRENLARVTGVTMDRISVKATTSEGLGFTGRGEGIAAMATATLVKT